MSAAKNRWEPALRHLRLALLGEVDAADVLERSRERIWAAREALDRGASHPLQRSSVEVVPTSGDAGTEGRCYLVFILGPNGIVGTHKLSACDDDEATSQARIRAEGCAFDIWDGWRFIGRFEPAEL